MSTKVSTEGSVGKIKSGVKRAGQKAVFSPVIEAMTRVGYGVRGFIYIIMGLLALSVTLGNGGALTDQQGAIAAVGRQPAGKVFLWVILIGLVSYSLWGVIRAVFDPLYKGHDLKGLLSRTGFLFSAAGYAILVPSTYGLIMGAGNTAKNGANIQQFMASIMSLFWGRYLIGLIGLVVFAVGMYQIYLGFNASFDKQYQTYAMTTLEVKVATQLGRFGTAARGVVFGVVGILVCLAALKSNSSQPVGFDAALTALMRQPYGVWLLGVIAIGLIAFGVYSMLSLVWFRTKR